MLKFMQPISMVALVLFTQLPCTSQELPATPVNYEGSQENFANPERGWYDQYDHSLSLNALRRIRRKGITLVRRYYRIDKYRNQPLPKSYLDNMTRDMKNMRKAGLKTIIRFAYNWGDGPDAPLDRISSHIDQVKPILLANYDVIALVEAGFIGYWGEWHSSSHGLHTHTEAKKKVLEKLLASLPPQRMVALRYPKDKKAIYNNSNPISPEEAYNSSPRSRTGHHNDCFLAAADDWGTYPKGAEEAEKRYLEQDNRYVVQEGETCNPSVFSGCPTALKDLQRLRWDAMNLKFHLKVLDRWKREGCYEEISRRLGYRFRLIRSEIQDAARPGSALRLKIQLVNEGWGKLYNPRLIEIVLRHTQTKKKYYLKVNQDPRLWLGDQTVEITTNTNIPDSMPSGDYAVLLNLPDPEPQLYARKEYAIRLANKDVWEKATGYNSLLKTVSIRQDVPVGTKAR